MKNFEVFFDLERKLLDPATRNNKIQLNEILHPDFQEFGSSGRQYTKQETIDALTAEEFIQVIPSEFKALQLSDDVNTHNTKSHL